MDEVGQAKGIYFNYFIKAATAATKDQRRHLGILVAQAIAMASKMPSMVALMERVSPAPDVDASSYSLVKWIERRLCHNALATIS